MLPVRACRSIMGPERDTKKPDNLWISTKVRDFIDTEGELRFVPVERDVRHSLSNVCGRFQYHGVRTCWCFGVAHVSQKIAHLELHVVCVHRLVETVGPNGPIDYYMLHKWILRNL